MKLAHIIIRGEYMDDMILNDEIYDKMQAEYDRQNIPLRALGGIPPFQLNAPYSPSDTPDTSEPAPMDVSKICDIYHHIYSIEYEIYSYLCSIPSSSMIGRLICLKKRTLSLIEELLNRDCHQAPEAKFLPEMEDVNYREGQLCSYMLACELYDQNPSHEHNLLLSYLSVGMATLSN